MVFGGLVTRIIALFQQKKWRKRGAGRTDSLLIYPQGISQGSHQCLHWWQQHATGMLRLCSSNPSSDSTKNPTPFGVGFFVVGEDGFEPSKRNAADLQSVPFGHSGTPPDIQLLSASAEHLYYTMRTENVKYYFLF